MSSRALSIALLAAALCGCERGALPAVAAAANTDPEALLGNGMTARQVIEARELHMKDLGGSLKSLRTQLRAGNPNLELIRFSVQEIQRASEDLPGWFPAGSGPQTGVEMRSLVEVWSDAEGFTAAANEFRRQAASLSEIARGSDVGAIQKQQIEVGRTCGDCHDVYRAEEKEDEDDEG